MISWVKKWVLFIHEMRSQFDLNYQWHRLFHERKFFDRFLNSRRHLAKSTRFSIIVPTYGIEKLYIEHLILCLKGQTYDNWQLCICDDGDPNTEVYQMLQNLSKDDSVKYKVIRHENNQGICKATLSAIALADFEFLVFVDADDILHRKTLEIVAAKLAESDEYDFLYSDHDHLTDWGLRVRPVRKPGWSPELLLHCNYINHLTVMKKELYQRCEDLFAEWCNGAQDWHLCAQALHHAKRVGHIPLPLYHWRLRKGSVSVTPMAKPWAIKAGAEVRKKMVTNLNCELQFNNTNHRVEFCPEETSKLSLIVFTHQEALPHPFEVKNLKVHYKKINSSMPGLINQVFDESNFKAGSFVLFLSDKQNRLDGQMEAAMAYASLPNIGCVWPFANGTRGGYTISSRNNLTALPLSGHSFSGHSGNILTGPLHGLLIKSEILQDILPDLKTILESNSLDTCEELGSLIGLACINKGLRNLSVNCISAAHRPNDIKVKFANLPNFDPYL